ncbi:MAG: F-box protein [Candidatus Margulisiibacteriota bacterium]
MKTLHKHIAYFSQLPQEIKEMVMGQLPTPDLLRLSTVSRSFYGSFQEFCNYSEMAVHYWQDREHCFANLIERHDLKLNSPPAIFGFPLVNAPEADGAEAWRRICVEDKVINHVCNHEKPEYRIDPRILRLTLRHLTKIQFDEVTSVLLNEDAKHPKLDFGFGFGTLKNSHWQMALRIGPLVYQRHFHDINEGLWMFGMIERRIGGEPYFETWDKGPSIKPNRNSSHMITFDTSLMSEQAQIFNTYVLRESKTACIFNAREMVYSSYFGLLQTEGYNNESEHFVENGFGRAWDTTTQYWGPVGFYREGDRIKETRHVSTRDIYPPNLFKPNPHVPEAV